MTIMKFSGSNIANRALTALGTVTIFFIVLYTSISAVPPVMSERISWDEAVKLRSAYLGFKPLMVEYTDGVSGRPVKAPLQGFKMDARLIDEVINHNQNGPGGDATADSMLIYFGIEGFSGSGVTKTPNYTIIVVGVKDGVIMKNPKSGDINQSSVMDKADPCPPNCPN